MSPKTGPRTAREMAWLKTVPRAMADGLTGGRSLKGVSKVLVKVFWTLEKLHLSEDKGLE